MTQPQFNPTVAVIIPFSEGLDDLKETVTSILAQSYQALEVVIVDASHSQQDLQAITEKLGSRVRYLKTGNAAPAQAINSAIEATQSDYVTWISAGRRFSANRVHSQISALGNMYRGRVVVYGETNLTDDLNHRNFENVRPDQFRYATAVGKTLPHETMLFPRSIFSECGLLNPELRFAYGEEFCFRAAKRFRFVQIPEVFLESLSQKANDDSTAAKREFDAVYSGFIAELTPEEIVLGIERQVSIGYAEIASKMGAIGRKRSARVAIAKSLRTLPTSVSDASAALVKIFLSLPLYRFLKPVFRLVPIGLKDDLKRILFQKRDVQLVASASKHIRDFGLREKFSEVYEKNFFDGDESLSGKGSDLIQTAIIRKELPRLVEELKVETFVDAPCGDWFWMRDCNLGVKKYFGIDIVPSLVQKNQHKYGDDAKQFLCLDLASDPLPSSDVVLSRDCLEHLSYSDAFRVIENIKRSGATYLITTTFTDRDRNFDLGESVWRPLNKQRAPFNFPEPIRLINEGCTEGDGLFGDKCLGVWRLSDIQLGAN